MNITWLGLSCFKISEKIDGQEVVVVTSPYDKTTGLFPPKLKADIVVISQDTAEYNYTEKISGNLDEQPFIIDRSGEYEVKKIFVSAFEVEIKGQQNQKNIIHKFELNNISIGFLGGLQSKLSESILDKLGDIDVLLLPVGDQQVINGSGAAEVVRQIEPRLVIPMHYKVKDLKIKLDDETKFIKEMGGKFNKDSKLKLSRKDLAEDQTEVAVLEKV